MRSMHLIRFTGATVSEDGSRWSRTVLNVMAATLQEVANKFIINAIVILIFDEHGASRECLFL